MSGTPRFVVAALVFLAEGDSLLLVKQSYGEQYWSLPGGAVEFGETIEQAAIREVREETGLEVRIKRVIGMYVKPADESLAVTFKGEIVGGSIQQTTDETSACQYWPMNQLPELTRAHLRERVADYRRRSSEVAFQLQ